MIRKILSWFHSRFRKDAETVGLIAQRAMDAEDKTTLLSEKECDAVERWALEYKRRVEEAKED